MKTLLMLCAALLVLSCGKDDPTGPKDTRDRTTYSVTLSSRSSTQAFKFQFNGTTYNLARDEQKVIGRFPAHTYGYQAFRLENGNWFSFASGDIDVNNNRTARVYDNMVRWD